MVSCRKCYFGTLIYIFIVLVLTFFVFFVIVPFSFKFSTEIQRNLVFPTWYVEPKNYSNLSSYPLKGVRNFYVTVNEAKNITLGVVQVLPDEVLSEFIKDEDYDYEKILKDPKYNVLLFFHGNGQDRLGSMGMYQVLRRFFNIIACDYRGYGDSSMAKLTEHGVVEDVVAFYKIIRNITAGRIFLWGHSLGTGVALHSASILNSHKLTPSGVMLEAPFTSITDVMRENVLAKLFSWLPWFDYTIIDPMIENGFNFDSQRYIVDVDSPVMIIHAKDDEIIPYTIATKLYQVAIANRNDTYQGNVTYHLLDAMGYGHEWIFEDPSLPQYISEFIATCINFEKYSNKSVVIRSSI